MTSNIIPLNTNSNAGGDALAAGAGAVVGSLISNGGFWGGRNMNGFGGGDWGGHWQTQSHSHLSDQIQLNGINGSINGVKEQISQLNTSTLQGQGQAQVLTCQGTSAVVNAIKDADNNIAQILCRDFGNTNQTIERVGYQNALQATTNANAQTLATATGFAQISREMADCCCKTNANITEQANATRLLMTKQHYQSRIDTLNDKIADMREAHNNEKFNDINMKLAVLLSRLPATATTTPAFA